MEIFTRIPPEEDGLYFVEIEEEEPKLGWAIPVSLGVALWPHQDDPPQDVWVLWYPDNEFSENEPILTPVSEIKWGPPCSYKEMYGTSSPELDRVLRNIGRTLAALISLISRLGLDEFNSTTVFVWLSTALSCLYRASSALWASDLHDIDPRSEEQEHDLPSLCYD